MDETVKTLNSVAASEASLPAENPSGSHTGGALSKATSVLFRRRMSRNFSIENEHCNERGARASGGEELSKSSPAALGVKDTSRVDTNDTCQHIDPAIRARQEAIRAQQRILGKCHPDVLFSLECLMRFHRERGEHYEALSVFEEKQRLSRESYLIRSQERVPMNVVVAHEG